jgi:hypothetical protein
MGDCITQSVSGEPCTLYGNDLGESNHEVQRLQAIYSTALSCYELLLSSMHQHEILDCLRIDLKQSLFVGTCLYE